MSVEGVIMAKPLDQVMKGIRTNIEKAVAAASIEMFGNIVKRTPVGNPSLWQNPDSAPPGYVGGRLRGNWTVNLGSASGRDTEHVDAGGGATITQAAGTLVQFKLENDTIYFVNNLPYAMAVEEGRSSQAPQGMARLAEAEFKPVFDRIAREYRT